MLVNTNLATIVFGKKIFVTTPTTASTQPNLITIDVGLEVIMTLHHPPHPVLGIAQG